MEKVHLQRGHRTVHSDTRTRRQLTKKSFIADRRLELICHATLRRPEDIARAIKTAGCLAPEHYCDMAPAEFSFCLGCAFGRWDIRFAVGDKPASQAGDPFAPLPICPPGMLQNDQGVPLNKDDFGRLQETGGWHYPLDIPWYGILVDDPGHPLDVESRVRRALEVIWEQHWEAVEREVCEILRVGTLRDYLRKPAGFFADHLSRYSKSRRQAPIYWPISSSGFGYTVWLYFHRFSRDTHSSRRLQRLRQTQAPSSATDARQSARRHRTTTNQKQARGHRGSGIFRV